MLLKNIIAVGDTYSSVKQSTDRLVVTDSHGHMTAVLQLFDVGSPPQYTITPSWGPALLAAHTHSLNPLFSITIINHTILSKYAWIVPIRSLYNHSWNNVTITIHH